MRLTSAEIGYFEDYEDDEVLEVAFAGNDEAGTRRSFSFQRTTYEPEEQDVQCGMDSYCVSTERGGTSYGCVRRVRLEGTALTIEFVPEDADDLGFDPLVEIDLCGADVTGLGAKLRDVLDWGAQDERPDLHF